LNSTTTVSYKLIKKIKDDKFAVDDLQHYSLLLQVGVRDFQLCVVDTRSNQCLLLEDFILASVKSYSQLTEALESIFDNHHLLKAGFWKSVKVAFKNNKFSLVPASLFSNTSVLDYLSLNVKVDPEKEELLYYKQIKTDAVNTFAVNKVLYKWLIYAYPNIKLELIPQSSGLIEGVLSQINHHKPNSLFLYVDRFKLHIVTTRNGKLEYYNQFVIKQFSDYIKYIMTVMKGLGHNQKTTPVVLWGYVGKQSPHFHEFAKYIKNLSFGDRPDFLKYGYFFDEVQDHHFFDLYSLYLCD
jgi:hypothetical protein